jgi:hypothetical protein
MSWRRTLLLILFVPPLLLEQAFGWLAGLSYDALCRENARIREASRQKKLRGGKA